MLDPNWVLAEYRGEIDVLATNRPYNNHYCGLFHLKEGRIILFRERIAAFPTLNGAKRSRVGVGAGSRSETETTD